MEVWAADGRRITTLVPDAGGNYPLPEMNPGLYLVRTITAGGRKYTARFVVR